MFKSSLVITSLLPTGVPKQESSTSTDMKSGKVALEDDEYDLLMSKLDELEKEELEAENSESSEQELIETDYDPIPNQKSRLIEVTFRVASVTGELIRFN